MNRFFTFFLLLLTCNMFLSVNQAMWESAGFGLLPPSNTVTGATAVNPFGVQSMEQIDCHQVRIQGGVPQEVCTFAATRGGYSTNNISEYYNNYKPEGISPSGTATDQTTVWGAGDVIKGIATFTKVFAGSIVNVKPTLNYLLPDFPTKDGVLTMIEIFWILGLLMTIMVMIMGRYNPSTS